MASKSEANTTTSPQSEKNSALNSSEQIEEFKATILEDRKQLESSERPRPAIASLWSRNKRKVQLEEIATQPSVYDDPELAKYFQPHPQYENSHRFDPGMRWTWAEELPLVKKIDWKITAWSCIAFFALDLDRSNLLQANTDNFLDDLGLNTRDYNLGNTAFYTSFLLAELPSQLVSKKIGPDVWIPAQMMLWSVVASCQFWLNGRMSFLATRALLGLLQGGFIPDLILYMSYFFKGTELPFRLALFWMANRLTDVVAPLLAYGLPRLRGVHGYEGWRWLFLIEGLLTLAIGIWSWFQMAASPTQTESWYRPKGWFNEREEKIMVNRILRDDPSKGDMHNRQAITLPLMWKSLCDFDLWPLYLIGLVFGLPAGAPDRYLTLTLRNLGFDTFNSNLLSIPCQVGTTINVGILLMLEGPRSPIAYADADHDLPFGNHRPTSLPWNICSMLVSAMFDCNVYAAFWQQPMVIIGSGHGAAQLSNTASNASGLDQSKQQRSLYNMAVQLQSIISSNVYREDDKPYYRRGNRILLSMSCVNIVIYLGAKAYYTWRNKQKSAKWNVLSEEENIHYNETTTDQGAKRRDFQFVS